MNVLLVAGWIAAALTAAVNFPQLYKSWTTKKTNDVSMTTQVFDFILCAFWLAYGVGIVDYPIIIGDAVCIGAVSGIILLKLKYDKKK